MDFRLDQSLVALGIDTVVVGIARNVDPQAVLPPSFLEKKKELEQWALQCQTEEVVASPVIKGYTDLLQKVWRSIEKSGEMVYDKRVSFPSRRCSDGLSFRSKFSSSWY